MTSRFEGLAEVRARFYFQDILSWIKGLYAAMRSISSTIASLKKEFDLAVPRSSLSLSAKSRQEYGPTSLQWAQLKTLGSTRDCFGSPSGPKVLGGLKGKLNPDWAFHIAHRHDLLPRFREFDRAAAALNEARRHIFKAVRFLKVSGSLRLGAGDAPVLVVSSLNTDRLREAPAFPADCLASDLPAGFRRFLKGAWLAAFTLGLAEEEFNDLALEVSRNPSAKGISVDLTERSDATFIRQVRWIHEASQAIIPKLTHLKMKRLRIKEAVRPVLHQKDLKRARVNERFEKYGKALDRLRKYCTDAQSPLSSALMESKALLRNDDSSRSWVPPGVAS